MNPSATRRMHRAASLPGYVFHPSFATATAVVEYHPSQLLERSSDHGTGHMPDEVTRDHARRMHYAAHRMHTAKRPAEQTRWQQAYTALRDRIVLGNRKLIYRAVRRRMPTSPRADDLIGDSHVVLIQAVAAYNPWLGVRFSTYAYTCLIRALARAGRRMSADWLDRALPLDALPDGAPVGRGAAQPASSGTLRLDEFLRHDHPLLSDREKAILIRRFNLRDERPGQTLETVGRELGLSKERVRQVQASALTKLRQALAPA